MAVEQDIPGRFRMHGEDPKGFNGKTDEFGSRVVNVTDSPGSSNEVKAYFVYPNTEEGRKFYSQRSEETKLARQRFVDIMNW